jgi:hypothetical protein
MAKSLKGRGNPLSLNEFTRTYGSCWSPPANRIV